MFIYLCRREMIASCPPTRKPHAPPSPPPLSSDHPSSANLSTGGRSLASPTAPAKATPKLRLKLAGSTSLLALATGIAASVLAAFAPGRTTTTAPAFAIVAAHHALGRRVRALLLDVRRGHDLGGQVQPFAQVVETLGREGVVVPLPGELRLEVAARGEGLAGFDDLVGKRGVGG